MPTQFMRLAAVLFAALVMRVAGSGPNGITVGDLAVQADEATWRNAIANLNATNSTQVTGYNISAEYSKSPEQTPLWELAISVTADIPAKKPAGKFFTGTAINWSPPWELKRNGTVRGDKSWTLCMSVYRGAKLQSGKANVDSTCGGILPDKCVKELQQRASSNSVCSITGSLPSSCVEEMGKADVEGFGVETSFAGATNKTSVGFYYGTEREGHDKGNVTAYDDAIRQIWVVVTGFAHNTTDSGRNSARQNNAPEGSLRCLRAETFKDASRSYSSAAPGQHASMVSVVLAAFLSVSIAILT